MMKPPDRHVRAGERSLRHVFAAPVCIALASTIGLLAALIGDGILDATSWVGLGAPLVVSVWYVFMQDHT